MELNYLDKLKNKTMKVKNINGTSNNNCKCGSWLKHWENFSGRVSLFCSASNCSEIATDGAHVQKEIGNNNWYIIPLCRGHNKSFKELYMDDSIIFVSANVNETCG